MISLSFGQQAATGANTNYVKRVLDNIEIDFFIDINDIIIYPLDANNEYIEAINVEIV